MSISVGKLSISIRKREGLTFAQASERFGVGIASLTRWSKQVEPKATRENRPRKIDLDKLAKDVKTYPDAYQYERAVRFGVTPKAIWQALRKLGVTYKKSLSPSQGGRSQTYCLPGEDHRA